MRIISKFNDYYDVGQAQGQDQSQVFLRATESVPLDTKINLPPSRSWLRTELDARVPYAVTLDGKWVGSKVWRCHICPGLVVFAGRLYPYVEVRLDAFNAPTNSPSQFVFNQGDLLALLAEADCILPSKKNRRFRWSPPHMETLGSFFELKGDTSLLPLAVEHHVAIARLHMPSHYRQEGVLEINPVLKTIEFFRCLDAWQAFQELGMFVGNLAGPGNKTLVLSEKSQMAKHGFDKWSFRKMPEGGAS